MTPCAPRTDADGLTASPLAMPLLAVTLGLSALVGAAGSARAQDAQDAQDAQNAPVAGAASPSDSGDSADAGVADAGAAAGAAATEPAERRRLRVGVAGSPPFNFVGDDGRAGGPSLEIWGEVAAEHGWEYDVEVIPNVGEAIDRVARGDLDVAVGPISITAGRAERVAFTQPYWQADLAILSVPSAAGSFVDAELMWRVLRACGVLLLVLIMVGGLIYAAERRAQSFNTFGDAVWFALVTMTTVGYGDRVPVTRVGRILTSVWMLFAMIFGASLTAQIATALTLAQLGSSSISSADDLEGRRVASKEGSTALDFARNHHARAVPAPSLEDAVDLLIAGEVDAVVFDRPALQYQVAQHPDAQLMVSEAGYDSQGYGFAFSVRSTLRRDTDIALLSLREHGRLASIGEAWIRGERSLDSDAAP